MNLDESIRQTEAKLFAQLGLAVNESYITLPRTGLRIRLLDHGSGPPVLLLHGVSLCAAVWAPMFDALAGYRLLAVDLPGHGLSDGVAYQPARVRDYSQRLIDDLIDGLGLEAVPVIGHSLGGMFALWHAATGSGRISTLALVGDPAVALPGVRVRMPLSLLTVRGLGPAVLRSPIPHWLHRRLLQRGLGLGEVASAPEPLIDVLRLAARRPANAATVASLMRALNRFRRPRPASVLTAADRAAIQQPTTFIWGSDDPYLSPDDARVSIAQLPNATLHVLAGGHAPWLIDGSPTAELIRVHLSSGAVRTAGSGESVIRASGVWQPGNMSEFGQ